MERTQIFDLMGELKLCGMRSAYDEVMAAGVKRQHEPPQIVGEAKSDMVETDKAIEVSIELPGMDMKDIEVTVNDDMLTVKGEKNIERQEEKKGYYLSERSYGAIYRTIPLPPAWKVKRRKHPSRTGF
jgi:HSP20 family molecular chaperone IbpA